jgi:uncharacterized membrane protein HdeD (DUF308 family)
MSRTVLHPSSDRVPAAGRGLDDARAERMIWWLAIAGAAASIVLGVLVLSWPGETLLVGAALFGVWLLVHGLIRIVNAVTATATDNTARTLSGVIGVLFVLAGVFCVRNLLVSLAAVATVIGATWLIGGIVEIVSAFGQQYDGALRLIVAALGVLLVLGGLVILVWPVPSLATLVYLTGIWLVLTGVVQLVLVIRTRPAAAPR